jgi:hypothetical protein
LDAVIYSVDFWGEAVGEGATEAHLNQPLLPPNEHRTHDARSSGRHLHESALRPY